MIDVSDELGADAGHLAVAERSGAAHRLGADALPIAPGVAEVARRRPTAIRFSSRPAGGEDYELLAALPLMRSHDLEPLAEDAGRRASARSDRRGDRRRPRAEIRRPGGRALLEPGGFDHLG